MKRKKRLHIFIGTKGQFVKMAPILRELDKRGITYNLVHTSQHLGITREISAVFKLKRPDLYVVQKEKDLESLPQMAVWFSKVLILGVILKIWKGEKGIVLLHGDTESTLLGLLLAKISCLKVAHIEAGLRSYSLTNPFPEEIIRRITSRWADFLFAPSRWAYDNLQKEKRRGKIYYTEGNTVFDSLRYLRNLPQDKEEPLLIKTPYAIASIHRKETLYRKQQLAQAVSYVQLAAHKVKIIFILHKKTHYVLKKHNLLQSLEENPNIELCYSFLDYLSFMRLVEKSLFVITDGGGLQEETYFLDKPCLLLRKKTERQFGLGETACLSEWRRDKIEDFLNNYMRFKRKEKIISGNPAIIIVNNLEKELSLL